MALLGFRTVQLGIQKHQEVGLGWRGGEGRLATPSDVARSKSSPNSTRKLVFLRKNMVPGASGLAALFFLKEYFLEKNFQN